MKKLLTLALLLFSLAAQANTVTLAWSPSDGANGYKVYWGTASRVYTASMDVGPATQATIPGLINTVTYFFAVTAYNEIGESDYSDEVSTTIPPLPPAEYPAAYPGVFTWSYPITTDSLRGFIIHRQEVGVIGERQYVIRDPMARAIQMADLIPGSTYRFVVYAFTRFERRQILSAPSPVLEHLEPLSPYFWDTPVVFDPFFMEDGTVRLVFYGPQDGINTVFFSEDLITWGPLGQAEEFIDGRYRIFDTTVFKQRFYKIAPTND